MEPQEEALVQLMRDKVGRRSIRVMDLRSEKNLDQRIESVLQHHNAIRKGLGKDIFKKDQLKKDLLNIAPEILKFSQPVWLKIDEFKNKRKEYYLRVLKEYYLMLIMELTLL